MTQNFPPFTKSISWVDSVTGTDGKPLPPGETLADTVLGIRLDGDTAHGLGNYQYGAVITAPTASVTPAQLNAAIAQNSGQSNFVLPPGNYWLNAEQTDVLDGVSATSSWGSAEIPFSVPVPIVQPSNPTSFSVS